MSSTRRRSALVLASYLAVVCMALLAPFVHATSWQLVCSVGGSKRVATGESLAADPYASYGYSHGRGHGDADDHAMHCPLCMPAGAPPALVVWNATPVEPLAPVRQAIPSAPLVILVGAPPARGPPPAA